MISRGLYAAGLVGLSQRGQRVLAVRLVLAAQGYAEPVDLAYGALGVDLRLQDVERHAGPDQRGDAIGDRTGTRGDAVTCSPSLLLCRAPAAGAHPFIRTGRSSVLRRRGLLRAATGSDHPPIASSGTTVWCQKRATRAAGGLRLRRRHTLHEGRHAPHSLVGRRNGDERPVTAGGLRGPSDPVARR